MRKLSKNTTKKIIKLYQDGLGQLEICERLGVSQWSVSTNITRWKHSKCPFDISDFKPGNVKFCPYCGIRLEEENIPLSYEKEVENAKP